MTDAVAVGVASIVLRLPGFLFAGVDAREPLADEDGVPPSPR